MSMSALFLAFVGGTTSLTIALSIYIALDNHLHYILRTNFSNAIFKDLKLKHVILTFFLIRNCPKYVIVFLLWTIVFMSGQCLTSRHPYFIPSDIHLFFISINYLISKYFFSPKLWSSIWFAKRHTKNISFAYAGHRFLVIGRLGTLDNKNLVVASLTLYIPWIFNISIIGFVYVEFVVFNSLLVLPIYLKCQDSKMFHLLV